MSGPRYTPILLPVAADVSNKTADILSKMSVPVPREVRMFGPLINKEARPKQKTPFEKRWYPEGHASLTAKRLGGRIIEQEPIPWQVGAHPRYRPPTGSNGVLTSARRQHIALLQTNSGSAPENPPEPARTTQNVGVSSFSSGGGGGPVGVVTGGGGGGGTDSCLICAVAAAGLALAIS